MAKRHARRSSMQLPVAVKVEDGRVQHQVLSRDVSSRGIYLEFAAPVDVGRCVELLLTLPERDTQGKPIQVRCFGKVVRVEHGRDGAGQVGIAATIERYVIPGDATTVWEFQNRAWQGSDRNKGFKS